MSPAEANDAGMRAPATSASSPGPGNLVLSTKKHVDEEDALKLADGALKLNRWRPIWVPALLIGVGWLASLAGLPPVAGIMVVFGLLLALVAPLFIYLRHVRGGLLLNSLDLDPKVAKQAFKFAKQRSAGFRFALTKRRTAREKLAREVLSIYGESGWNLARTGGRATGEGQRPAEREQDPASSER